MTVGDGVTIGALGGVSVGVTAGSGIIAGVGLATGEVGAVPPFSAVYSSETSWADSARLYTRTWSIAPFQTNRAPTWSSLPIRNGTVLLTDPRCAEILPTPFVAGAPST